MKDSVEQGKSIGLIAGEGDLPALVAMSARELGYRVVSIALFSDAFNSLQPYSDSNYSLGIGQSGKILKTLKAERVKDVIIIGKVDKKVVFDKFRFDMRAIKLLARVRNNNDNTLMKEIEKEFVKEGMSIIDQASFLSDLSVPEGVLTRRAPTPEEMRDLGYGFGLAKGIGRLDVGQTVVVRDRAVLAVEAIEGTDDAIKRGCSLAGNGAVVVKVSKPGQDLRMDIPVVGLQTIMNMAQGNAVALGLEAGKTLLVNRDEALNKAYQAGIAIIGLSESSIADLEHE